AVLPAAALARAPPLRGGARGMAAGALLARHDALVRLGGGEDPEPALRRAALRRLRALAPEPRPLLPVRVEHARALLRVRGRLLRVSVGTAVGGRACQAPRRRQASARQRRLVARVDGTGTGKPVRGDPVAPRRLCVPRRADARGACAPKPAPVPA